MGSGRQQVKVQDRLRYAFDNTMAKGPIALIGWLGLVSLGVILVAALVIRVGRIRPEGGEELGVAETLWQALMHTLDSGAVAGDAGWSFRMVMFLVTMAGIFVVSMLIGILTSGLEERVEALRRGRSRVIEEDHTLILGWTPNIYTILSELVEANQNRRNPCVVILADRDKLEMENDIRQQAGELRNTRVVCRSGSPSDLSDLAIASPDAARAIIVLSPEQEDADRVVIKTLLTLVHNPSRRPEPYHIVAELRDPANLEVARTVGGKEVELVLTDRVISRITVQTSRHSGMSVIYQELLDFAGDEIYFQGDPRLVGRPFADALFAYEKAAVLGLRHQDGRVSINPPHQTLIQAGDAVIALAEDDDRILPGWRQPGKPDASAIQRVPAPEPQPERLLILGWNRRGRSILQELDQYVAPGSLVRIVAEDPDLPQTLEGMQHAVKHQEIELQEGDTCLRPVLEAADVPSFDHAIVLSYTDRMETESADTHTLVSLLHLRELIRASGKALSVVSEVLDVRNRALAEVTQADDFIVSSRLVSLMMTQIAENKGLAAVFADLFDAGGSEIYLRPVDEYLVPGVAVTFDTVLESARQRGEVAIGYRLIRNAKNPSAAFGVVLNPAKSEKVTFAPGDRIVVLSDA